MDMKRIEQIYTEVQEMQVELVKESIHVDAMYLTRTLGMCDDYIQKVDDYTGEVLRTLDRLESEIEDKKDQYAAKITELMSNDPDVKSGSTGAERENRAKLKLRDDNIEINNKTAIVKTLVTLRDILNRKSKKLSSSVVSVKKQWDACVESAKYLYLNNRESKEEPIFTSGGKNSAKLWSDPTIQTLLDDPEASDQQKVRNDESTPPIIKKGESTSTDDAEDFLKDL